MTRLIRRGRKADRVLPAGSRTARRRTLKRSCWRSGRGWRPIRERRSGPRRSRGSWTSSARSCRRCARSRRSWLARGPRAASGHSGACQRACHIRRRRPSGRATWSSSIWSARGTCRAARAFWRSRRSTSAPTTPGSRSSKTAGTGGCWPRSGACGGATGAPRRCSSRPANRGATGIIEHFNDTFERRFFRHERFTSLGQLTDRTGAFERVHNAQHRDRANGRRAPTKPRPSVAASRSRSTPSPTAGLTADASSSSAASAPTTSCGCSAAPSRCPTAAPTDTSPPRWTSASQSHTTCSSATSTAS